MSTCIACSLLWGCAVHDVRVGVRVSMRVLPFGVRVGDVLLVGTSTAIVARPATPTNAADVVELPLPDLWVAT